MPDERLHVYTPWISKDDVGAIRRVAESGWISSLGPEVVRFEEALAEYVGARQAIATTNGTTALHLALVALRIGPGDEVIIPNLTFIATASAVLYTGATPVFADVQTGDWNIAPEEVGRVRTKRTRAIIAVHLYGNPADCTALARSRIPIVEDAAEAIGAERSGRRTGTLGTIAAFSFYANKIITSGEGGMITTDNKKMADRMRFLRDHAMSKTRKYHHPEIGWNYRMTALQAAVGLSQLGRIDEILAAKERIARGYAERLRDIDAITRHPVAPPGSRGVYWMYSILLKDRSTRDRLARRLDEAGIETRPFFEPLSLQPPFRGRYGRKDFPISRDLSNRGLNLPSGPQLKDRDLDRICEVIRASLRVRPLGS